jgi:cell wall-associated NlpC family hydrolase
MSGDAGREPTASRRDFLRATALLVGSLGLPIRLPRRSSDPDLERLNAWVGVLRAARLSRATVPVGLAAIRVGELAAGSPYQAGSLDEYLSRGGRPTDLEPLVLSLSHFDCVTLVESCLAVARVAARYAKPSWERFGQEIQRMRYRGGQRLDYSSRLHYFSEWISDGQRRGLVRDLGLDLGAIPDSRPLRFMTEHRSSYPALADGEEFRHIQDIEQRLDDRPRQVIPTERIEEVADRIRSGDVLAFATETPGLDVSHAAFAHRGTDGVLRVLHAPLSGGVVEISRLTLPGYVKAIRHATGILVARPL